MALLKLSAKIILAIGYIYFEIWLWGLIHQFNGQHQLVDRYNAIIAFSVFPITALHNGLGWYVWPKFCSWRRRISEVEVERDMFYANNCLLSLRGGIIVGFHLELISQLDQWYYYFQAGGKTQDANICVWVIVSMAFEFLLWIMDLFTALDGCRARVEASFGVKCEANKLKKSYGGV